MTAAQRVIGVDCATDDTNVGVARARWRDGLCEVDEVRVCGHGCRPSEIIGDWLSEAPALLAIDAPLGWPDPLGKVLNAHRAGESLGVAAHDMFRRATDQFIKRRVGKTPLDVGADRIARTAHSALALIAELRHRVGQPIELVWEHPLAGIGAIEVYPAATLTSHGYRAAGYKKRAEESARAEIIASLATDLLLPPNRTILYSDANALDAVVCILAAKDFLDGVAMGPDDHALATKEGWIWVKAPSA